ncbi:hypothetical protein [Nitrosarchaeum sp.]|uniref:hypothetical protein n=1 Tax=Nitrosarchaeum sp. TaxID=2026886 RepID=UPI00247BA57B|nr:hypothetical protein [Nitrosarchaeum sp.]MCV0412280.1 hypothetical protein [Nitrosarchaeum sp.]
MTTKTILMMLPILCAIALLFTPSAVYAHAGHSHGGGGGCSNCTPPTLGVDDSGKRLVSGGFAINDQTFDVELFRQDLDSQILQIGEPVEITLKIYDDSGYDALKHVELNLGYEEKFLSGVMVPHHSVTIEWSKTFDGKTTTAVFDKQQLVKDVSVQVIDNNPIVGVKFTFTPVQKFDANTIVTKIWDQKRNASINYFHNVLDIVSNEPASVLVNSVKSMPEKISEKTTQESTISNSLIDKVNQDIKCSTKDVHLLRASDNSPVCVDAYQASILIQNNWAIPAQ